jgi:hypothetical protein
MTCRIVNSRPSLGKGLKRVEKNEIVFQESFPFIKSSFLFRKTFRKFQLELLY